MAVLTLVLCWSTPTTAEDAHVPFLKVSFLYPPGTENAPNYNAFDAAALQRSGPGGFAGPGLDQWSARSATFTESGNPWGLRSRIRFGGIIYLDGSWTRGKRSVAVVRSVLSTTLSKNGDDVAYDHQTNTDEIDTHVLAVGMVYDPLYRSKHASLGIGVGTEMSFSHHVRETRHIRYTRDAHVLVVEDMRDNGGWTNLNEERFYASLDAEVYPLGKRGPGIGLRTRYVPHPRTLPIGVGSLTGTYEIPIVQRRWTTTLTATIGF